MIVNYLKSLDAAATVITANQRLSKYLHHQYQIMQINSGLQSWPTPDILPLNAWIARSFTQNLSNCLLLSEQQEAFLWQKIITEALLEPGVAEQIIVNHTALAHTAQEAWSLLKQWQIPLSKLAQSHQEDGRLFYHWTVRFQEICSQQHWLASVDCADAVIRKLMTQPSSLPPHIIFAGFEEITPQLQQLIAVIKKHSQIHYYQASLQQANVQQMALSDEEAELYHMARWARAEFVKNPAADIACVVPQLDTIRHKVKRIFQEVFNGDDIPVISGPLFNISGGKALAHYPLVTTALLICQVLARTMVDIKPLCQLLGSPFIAAAEQELTSRALFAVALLNQGESLIDWRELLSSLKNASGCSLLLEHMTAVLDAVNWTRQNMPSGWAAYFAQLLELLGWPGERTLNSAEFQQLERMHSLLQEFASLDSIFPHEIELATAVNYLLELAQRTLFQPKSEHAPIQVLGVLEAVGLTFDRMWIMGMNDELWPTSASPNPLLPIFLQRQFNLPHSSSERELAFCQKLTNRFAHSAKEVIFSYSLTNKDILLRPSTLIRSFAPAVNLSKLGAGEQAEYSNDQMIVYIDDQGPAVIEGAQVKGGSGILKDQAACPFRAFAKFRLAARKLPTIFSGLSPQDRGIYLHEIMEKVWGVLQNHQRLCDYSEIDLQLLLRRVIHEVLTAKSQQRRILRNKKFLAIEQERLQQIISEWLVLEKQRPTFQVVAREKIHTVHLGGLSVHLRADREDELADGSRMIIDYKTGEPQLRDWFGERPDDPQLPLYCVSSAYPLQGIIFAQLRSDGSRFKGISAENYHIPGVVEIAAQKIDPSLTRWVDFQENQRRVLTRLAEEFLSGQAQVDPKEGKTCLQCDLQALCRIHTQAITLDDLEEVNE